MVQTKKQDDKIAPLPSNEARLVERKVEPARWRMRHRGLVLSFALVVLLPFVAAIIYLWQFAQPQYASNTGFVIRQEETGAASQLLGSGLSQMLGTQSGGNADLLFEFIQSQEIVERVEEELGLVDHYSRTWPGDPLFSIWPTATIEDLAWFWKRMVRITYDKASGLILVEVRARDPEFARSIATQVISQSERMINTLNVASRRDNMANAQVDLDEAFERLRAAREAMVAFQARTQILDPIADIQGRMGVLGNLQQQLAQTLVDYDLMSQAADAADPRVRQLERRIAAIEDRIIQERRSFSAQDVTVDNTDYPTLLSQYEGLRVEVEFSEQAYRAALSAMSMARTAAERQQLYLATFIQPTVAQRAEYPRRVQLVALTGFFALMAWAVLALVYYSLRDRG